MNYKNYFPNYIPLKKIDSSILCFLKNSSSFKKYLRLKNHSESIIYHLSFIIYNHPLSAKLSSVVIPPST